MNTSINAPAKEARIVLEIKRASGGRLERVTLYWHKNAIRRTIGKLYYFIKERQWRWRDK